MKKAMKKAAALMIILLALVLTIFLAASYFLSRVELVSAHYLSYQGNASKIYLLAATTSYGNANGSYITPAGYFVQKGELLFIVTATLRNDYTADDPPPPLSGQPPISPADGTAYLYLTAQLFDKAGNVSASDVSVSDFSLPLTPGEGVVLASGQTASANILLATSQTDINRCDVYLVFVGDSIPP